MSETENTSGKKLNELRVVDLRHELERRDLDRTGVKTALIDRLTEAMQKEGKDPESHIFEVSSDTPKAKAATPRLSRRSHGNAEVTQEEDSCSMESNDEVEENGEVKEINKDENHQEEKKEKQHVEEAQKNVSKGADETFSQPRVILSPLSSSLTSEATPNSDATSLQASNKETKDPIPGGCNQGDSTDLADQKSGNPEDSTADTLQVSAEKADVTGDCSDGQQESSETTSSADVQDSSKPTTDNKSELPKSAADKEIKSPTNTEKPTTDAELKPSKPSVDIEKDTSTSATDVEKKSSSSKAVTDKKLPKPKTTVAKKSTDSTSVEKKSPTKSAGKSTNPKPVDNKSPKRRATVENKKTPIMGKKSDAKTVDSNSTKRRTTADRKKSTNEKDNGLKSGEVKDRHATLGEVSESSNNATESAETGKPSVTDTQSSTTKKSTGSRTTSRGTKRKVSESKPVEQDGAQKTEGSQNDDKKEIGDGEKDKSEKSEGAAPDQKKNKTDPSVDDDEKKGEKKKRSDGGEKKPNDKRDVHSKERKRRSRSRDRMRRNPWLRARQDRRTNFRRTFPRRANAFDRYGGLRQRLLTSRKSPLSPMLDNDRFHRVNERRRDTENIVEHRAAEIARKNRDEALRIERERDRLRHEKEKLERLRAEVLRKEREQQRAERERLERERDELRRRSQIQIEERRGGLKRPFEEPVDSWDRGMRGVGVREIEAPQRYNDYPPRTPAPFPARSNHFEGRRRTEVAQDIVPSRRVTEQRSAPSRRRGNNIDRKPREKAYDRDRNNFESSRGRTVEAPQPWSDSPNDRQQGKYAASSAPSTGSHWGSTRNNQNWIPVVGPPLPPQQPQEHWSRIDSHGQPPSNMNRQPNMGPPSQLPPVFGGPRNEIMGRSVPMGTYSGNRYNVDRRF